MKSPQTSAIRNGAVGQAVSRPVFFKVGLWHLMIPESIEDMGFPISVCAKAHGRVEFLDRGLTFGWPPTEWTCVECTKRGIGNRRSDYLVARSVLSSRESGTRIAQSEHRLSKPEDRGVATTRRAAAKGNVNKPSDGSAVRAGFAAHRCTECRGVVLDGMEAVHECVGRRLR